MQSQIQSSQYHNPVKWNIPIPQGSLQINFDTLTKDLEEGYSYNPDAYRGGMSGAGGGQNRNGGANNPRLTRRDIDKITHSSDLSQIMTWLRDLSQGHLSQVTAALVVAKKKLKQQDGGGGYKIDDMDNTGILYYIGIEHFSGPGGTSGQQSQQQEQQQMQQNANKYVE